MFFWRRLVDDVDDPAVPKKVGVVGVSLSISGQATITAANTAATTLSATATTTAAQTVATTLSGTGTLASAAVGIAYQRCQEPIVR